MKPIHYEPHPVSPERKQELRQAGFRIVDARFAPQVDPVAEPAQANRPPKRRRKRAPND